MGLFNKPEAVYIKISNGKFVRSFREKTATSVERQNKAGNTVHEEFYNGLEGLIKNIKVVDITAGGVDFKVWEIDLYDGQTQLKLQVPYSSGYSKAILKKLPNINLFENVILQPNCKTVNGKSQTALFVIQNDKQILQYFTKDRPNNLPPLNEIKVAGVTRWDDSEQMAFLEEWVKNKILPKLTGATEAKKTIEESVEVYEELIPTFDEELTDEVPF